MHIQAGMIGSSLEHQVLEQLFATDTNAEGFSAVKAIQLANAEGQKIYTITKDNYQTIIPQLQLAPAAIADIQSAAQAGLTVTTHQKRIHINGYIILNDRGTGAYMINGGLYGAFISIATGLGLLDILLNKSGKPIQGTVSSMKNTVHMLGIFALFVQISISISDAKETYKNAKTGEEKVKIILDFTHMLGLTLLAYFATSISVSIISYFVASPIFIALLAMLVSFGIAYITSEPWFSVRVRDSLYKNNIRLV